MKAVRLALLGILWTLGSCHEIETWPNDALGNFDALCTIIDEHYCFLDYKNIDWQAISGEYRKNLKPDMNRQQLFDLCSDMLDRLEDGHVNLVSYFAVSYYRKWWSDYPQNFNWRLIQERYLDFDYTTAGGVSYKVLPGGVGYMRYESFAYGFGESFLDAMFLNMKECKGLIIDIRDNGGGDISRVEGLVSRFLEERILAGSIIHKTGPGHSDFSEPYEFYYEPQYNHVRWLRQVVILTNRSTFSAANSFVGVMRTLPRITVVGDRTGGGSGMPFSSELPCGWGIRFSACPVSDPEGNITEWGIDPSEGCHVDMNPESEYEGHDDILDFAIEMIKGLPDLPKE